MEINGNGIYINMEKNNILIPSNENAIRCVGPVHEFFWKGNEDHNNEIINILLNAT